MPWEKTFEESDVIDQAMQVFWEKGYAATSISDILEATGIKRGSLYNAFEGKHDLFLQSILKYENQRWQNLLRQLETVEDPREAILIFVDRTVQDTLSDPEKKGCMLVNTALDYSLHDDEVQKIVSDAVKQRIVFFENFIKRGQEQGVIPDSVQPRPTAKALVALLVGIRVLGRGVFGKAALQQIAEEARRLIS